MAFEDPAYNRPTGWICTNRWFGFDEVTFSEKFVRPVDSNAQDNSYALRLFTFYNYMKDAAVQTAAIDYRPAALKGVYKYEDNFIIWGADNYIDTAQVSVVLTKWNSIQSKNDTIGKARFIAYHARSSFTPFELNIEYSSTAQPDSITILLDPSVLGRYPGMDLQNEAHGGKSVFTVDNLELIAGSTAATTDQDGKKTLALYPNPAQDQIGFETLSGDAVITDITGKIVVNSKIQNENALDIHHLKKGLFILQIRNEEGIYTSRFEKL
ncbi:hypothetical protein D3C86_1491420 [compost metagenome]